MKTRLLRAAAAIALTLITAPAHHRPALADDFEQARKPPNIVVIMLDDVSDNIDFMHRTMALARSGTRYVNSFVNFPLCGPSRATFLTGQEARNHGVRWDDDEGLKPVGLVPQALQKVGYRTGLFGKRPKPTKVPMTGLGFDRSLTMHGPAGRYFDPIMSVDGEDERFKGYTIDIVYRSALQFSTEARQPYFTWIASLSAHAPALPRPRNEGACLDEPFKPGPAFNEPDVGDKPAFIQQIPPLDESTQAGIRRHFGAKCDVLQTDDRWIERFVRLSGPDTCVFLTSDNGFLQGQHRVTGKLLLYEESIRVPLIMWGCGAEKGGVERRLVSNTDLPATILELAGAKPGRPLDGRSLFAPERSDVRLMGRWGENETDGDGQGFSYGIRHKDWAFFRHKNGGEELYDLENDPAQEFNLADDAGFAGRRRALGRMLDVR